MKLRLTKCLLGQSSHFAAPSTTAHPAAIIEISPLLPHATGLFCSSSITVSFISVCYLDYSKYIFETHHSYGKSETKKRWLLLCLSIVTLCWIIKSLQNTTQYTTIITISTVQFIEDIIPSKEPEALEMPVASAVACNSRILLSVIYISYC
jgi:hypothetical protein